MAQDDAPFGVSRGQLLVVGLELQVVDREQKREHRRLTRRPIHCHVLQQRAEPPPSLEVVHVLGEIPRSIVEQMRLLSRAEDHLLHLLAFFVLLLPLKVLTAHPVGVRLHSPFPWGSLRVRLVALVELFRHQCLVARSLGDDLSVACLHVLCLCLYLPCLPYQNRLEG